MVDDVVVDEVDDVVEDVVEDVVVDEVDDVVEDVVEDVVVDEVDDVVEDVDVVVVSTARAGAAIANTIVKTIARIVHLI